MTSSQPSVVINTLIILQQQEELTRTSSIASSLDLTSIAQTLAESHHGAIVNVGQVISFDQSPSFKVIECLPFAFGGESSIEKTDWVILPRSSTSSSSPSLFSSHFEETDKDICPKLKEYYCHSLKQILKQNESDLNGERNADGEENGKKENEVITENDIATDDFEPIFVLGDFLPAINNTKSNGSGDQANGNNYPSNQHSSSPTDIPPMNIINISNLFSLVTFLCDNKHHQNMNNKNNDKQERRQNTKLMALLLRVITRIYAKLVTTKNVIHENHSFNSLLVTTSTLQALHLRHNSRVVFKQENEESEDDDSAQLTKTEFSLSMIQDDSLSDLLDSFCGIYHLLSSSLNANNASHVSCFGFLLSPETFYNLKRRLVLPFLNNNNNNNNHHFILENMLVMPQKPFTTTANNSNNNNNNNNTNTAPSANVFPDSSSIILRPLTRNIVMDPVDSSHLLQIRHSSDLLNKIVRKGDIFSINRKNDADDVNMFFAPLTSSIDVISRPMSPISNFFPQTQDKVYFFVESTKFVKGKASAGTSSSENSTEEYVKITNATAIAEGAPISHPELQLPSGTVFFSSFVEDVSKSTVIRTKNSFLPFSPQAFSRTTSFRKIFNLCRDLFSPIQQQQQQQQQQDEQRNHRHHRSPPLEFTENIQDESHNDDHMISKNKFKLLLFTSSSPKVATLPQLQLALSSLGIYFEVVVPNLLGGIENLKSISSLVCNATTSSGVLILYCADLVLYEHSEVIQWLVASAKQAHPLRIILVTESGDSSNGALAVLNTVSSSPALNLDHIGAQEGERRVFIQDLISSMNINNFSKFLNFRSLAQSSAGLFFMELYQWIVIQSVNRSGVASAGNKMTKRTIDQDFLIQQLESFKKQHGHNVTSSKLQQVHWKDIGGLEEQREEIMTVLRPPAYLANSNAKRRTGVLLMGPPGCGKTLLAKAVATECGMNFLSVKGPELLNMYVGESEKNIREVFKKAREAAPCIVFFDELDALAPARGAKGDSGGVMDRIVAQLLVELDGAVAAAAAGGGNNDDDDEDNDEANDDATDSDDDEDVDAKQRENMGNSEVADEDDDADDGPRAGGNRKSHNNSKKEKKMVFIIGATNRPDLLDPSLLRPGRFDRVSYVGLAETREDQLAAVRALTRKFKMADDISYESGNLARFLLEQDVRCIYTGADYYGFCADAMTVAVSEAVEKFQENLKKKGESQKQNDDKNSNANDDDDDDDDAEDEKGEEDLTTFVVTRKHFEDALKNLAPSVPMSELVKYQQLRKQYAVQKI